MFSPRNSVSPANHSTNFSIIIITQGWHNRPIGGRSAEWTLDSTPRNTNLKKIRARFPVREKEFSLLQNVQAISRAKLASNTMDTGPVSRGVKR
jgi:hypothetical protein